MIQTKQIWGLIKLVGLLLVAAVVVISVGCQSARADEAPPPMFGPPPPPPQSQPAQSAQSTGAQPQAQQEPSAQSFQPAQPPPYRSQQQQPPVQPSAPPPPPSYGSAPTYEHPYQPPQADAPNDGPRGGPGGGPGYRTREYGRRRWRIEDNIDIMFGFQGQTQPDIDVPTATERWRISGGGNFWLGYRHDLDGSPFSLGAKFGFDSFNLEQDNSTTGLNYHHRIDSLYLMPNIRLTVPLDRQVDWFLDAGAGVGIHDFVLDRRVPDGTPTPTVDTSAAVDVLTGFLFVLPGGGPTRTEAGFDVDWLGSEAKISKLYPDGTAAAQQFRHFDLGSVALDFNLSVKF
ncbi:MAG: hypothetical protein ACREJ2_05385 [Planctomycetota bacterium]